MGSSEHYFLTQLLLNNILRERGFSYPKSHWDDMFSDNPWIKQYNYLNINNPEQKNQQKFSVVIILCSSYLMNPLILEVFSNLHNSMTPWLVLHTRTKLHFYQIKTGLWNISTGSLWLVTCCKTRANAEFMESQNGSGGKGPQHLVPPRCSSREIKSVIYFI